MKNIIMTYLNQLNTKRFETADLESFLINELEDEYEEQGGYLLLAITLAELTNEGTIKPVKASKINSLSPPLYNRYQFIKEEHRPTTQLKCLSLGYHTKIGTSFYENHPEDVFEKDRPYIEVIDRFLKTGSHELITANQRSFQLFLDEKFLVGDLGRRLLKRIGITLEDLCCFATGDPFDYVKIDSPAETVNVLIIENRDTYHCLELLFEDEGITQFCGIPFSYLMFGSGKKGFNIEWYLSRLIKKLNSDKVNSDHVSIYYFGDIDPTGIWMWYVISSKLPYPCRPLVPMYEALLNKHSSTSLPEREYQPQYSNTVEAFLNYFKPHHQCQILRLLHAKTYLPEEGLTLVDLRRMGRKES